jgi:hypothetical protein
MNMKFIIFIYIALFTLIQHANAETKQREEISSYFSEPRYCTFRDLEGDEWYHVFAVKMCRAGIIDGYENLTFKGGDEVKRVEFIKMVVAAIEKVGQKPLSNYGKVPSSVDSKQWYYPYLQKAYGFKNPNNNEEPIAFWSEDDYDIKNSSFWVAPIKREEAAHILMNAKKLKPEIECILPGKKELEFPDVSKNDDISTWIYTTCANDIFDGYPDGYFRPDNPLARSEAMKVICKAFFLCPLEYGKNRNLSEKQKLYNKYALSYFELRHLSVNEEYENRMAKIEQAKNDIHNILEYLPVAGSLIDKDPGGAMAAFIKAILKNLISKSNLMTTEKAALDAAVDIAYFSLVELPGLAKSNKSTEQLISIIFTKYPEIVAKLLNSGTSEKQLKRDIDISIRVVSLAIATYSASTQGNILGPIKESFGIYTEGLAAVGEEIAIVMNIKNIYNEVLIPAEYSRVYYIYAKEKLSQVASYYNLSEDSTEQDILNAIADSLSAEKRKFFGGYKDYNYKAAKAAINDFHDRFESTYESFEFLYESYTEAGLKDSQRTVKINEKN